MSTTYEDIFADTIQETHLWLKELMEELRWDEQHRAYLALKSTLQALRDRLTVEEAVQLGAQLPMLIRGFYYEGWNPAGKPVKETGKAAFLKQVETPFRMGALDAESIVRGVFRVLAKHLAAGTIANLKRQVSPALRDLWP